MKLLKITVSGAVEMIKKKWLSVPQKIALYGDGEKVRKIKPPWATKQKITL